MDEWKASWEVAEVPVVVGRVVFSVLVGFGDGDDGNLS